MKGILNKAASRAQLRKKIMRDFDPNAPGQLSSGVFGLPFTPESSEIIILPAPWEATVSFGSGTSAGPEAVLEASRQVDLYHEEFPDLWKCGIALDPELRNLESLSTLTRRKAAGLIKALESGKDPDQSPKLVKDKLEVNRNCAKMVDRIRNRADYWLDQGRIVGLLGGDHSTPLGLIQALSVRFPGMGILQIDAHMDLRKSYEGFTFSHASIMYNALQLKTIGSLVQLGIRDSCDEEQTRVRESKGRVKVFSYAELNRKAASGTNWKEICDSIIRSLPSHVYLSFDIDGLDPSLCPNTGTPVPGGFSFHQITYLLSRLAASKKRIVGFDLNEVSPRHDGWDANVGARMLFHLCGVSARSVGLV